MHLIQYLLQSLSLIIWLLIIPFLTGLLPARFMPQKHRNPGTIFLLGYIIFFAVFELISLIVTFNVIYNALTTLLNFFTPAAIILAALGLGTKIILPAIRNHRETTAITSQKNPIKNIFRTDLTWEAKIIWLLFFIILAFQLFMSITHASFDGDDAFYIVQSLTAAERDVLYRIDPYTGMSTAINPRSAMAAFPIWIAMIAEKSRIHSTIISHSIIPLVLLPMTYLLYFQIAKSLLKNQKKESLPIFMVIIAVIQMFGNVSIYTGETFLMTRTWQGKSFAANFIIPAVIWLFLLIGEQLSEKKDYLIYWLLLALLIWAAGLASAMAVFLAVILCAASSFYLSILYRKITPILKTCAACIPGAIFILLYTFLR